ncbi:MAG TPA: class I SAM-dependent methyltransferase [Steroidobacteraceae bacterium]|nr:class I SAM-dependent methyltransferase [Steroidobacteraceae bacterium]
MPQAPHPPLTQYYAETADRAGWVRRLFDRTARDYDRIERAMAFGSGSRYRRQALHRAGLKSGMRVLDIGTGTGLIAREAARLVGPSGSVIGVDPSVGMLERANVPPGVRMVSGIAEAIPAPAECADFVSMGFALRHIEDLSAAFREYERVLVPGGLVCLLEITPPEGRLPRALLKAYMKRVVPWMARCMAAHRDTPELIRYFWDTIEACVHPGSILAALRAAGFVDVHRHVELGVFSEYRARKPKEPV